MVEEEEEELEVAKDKKSVPLWWLLKVLRP